jgi:hypothetical protein
VLGWREWVSLPLLGIDWVKCKVDTGARTSALHAFYLERVREHGRDRVRFGLHPFQRDQSHAVMCTADVLDERIVSDSGGHREQRLVIHSEAVVGQCRFGLELTLTNRDTMRFRMLLGRTALADRFLVDPSRSYLAGRPPRGQRRAPVATTGQNPPP